MAQLMAVMAVVSAVSSIAGGVSKQAAAQKEAQALENQAILSERESQDDAQIKATYVRKFAANQKSAFLKNGVTLAGSPLMVLDDTYDSGQQEVNAVIRSGAARAQLLRDQAGIRKSEGRSALISGIGSGVSSIASYAGSAQGAGLFGGSAQSGAA